MANSNDQRPNNDRQMNWIDALVAAADAVVVAVVDAVEMVVVVVEEMFIAGGRLAEDVVEVVVVVDVVVEVVVAVWVVAVEVWNLWWMLLNSCFKMESALKFYNHIHQFK